jgi:mitochondrial inner membrane protein COX18
MTARRPHFRSPWNFNLSLKLRNPTPPRARRSFHSTPQRRFIEPVISATHHVLESVHATTLLPWVGVLPLTAFLVRAALIAPITVYTRRAQQRQYALRYVLLAWRSQIRQNILRDMGSTGPKNCEKQIAKAMRSKQAELYKRWNCGRWKTFLPLAQLPVWLVVIETIRRMCGTHRGLLGLIFSRQEIPSSKNPDLGASSEASTTATPGLGDSLGIAETVAYNDRVAIEPSFALEGALWFPDLLVPDPLLILPFILSGSLFMNIYLNTREVQSQDLSVYQRRLKNTLKIFALAVGPMTLQVPSAILVYWISSSFFALGQNVLLDRFLPLSPSLNLRKQAERTEGMDDEQREG